MLCALRRGEADEDALNEASSAEKLQLYFFLLSFKAVLCLKISSNMLKNP